MEIGPESKTPPKDIAMAKKCSESCSLPNMPEIRRGVQTSARPLPHSQGPLARNLGSISERRIHSSSVSFSSSSVLHFLFFLFSLHVSLSHSFSLSHFFFSLYLSLFFFSVSATFSVYRDHGLEFLPFRFWIGLWTMLYLILVVAFDLSALVSSSTSAKKTKNTLLCLAFCHSLSFGWDEKGSLFFVAVHSRFRCRIVWFYFSAIPRSLTSCLSVFVSLPLPSLWLFLWFSLSFPHSFFLSLFLFIFSSP